MSELDDELQFHLEARVAELMAAGMSRLEAERTAHARLGDVRALKEYCKDMERRISLQRFMGRLRTWRPWHALAAVSSDLRHATRTLLRARGFTATAVGTLGFGLALCVIVLTAVNTYLVRGLPYPESDRLFNVALFDPRTELPRAPEKLDWSSLADIIELPISWDLDSFNLRGAPYSEAASGTWVTPGYMTGFGIRPALGRAFEASDYAPDGAAVAIISHRLWQTRFGGDPAVVGRHFESYSSDRPAEVGTFTVVGVLPADFWHMNSYTDILAPLRAPSVPYVVRLREGVSPLVASDRITALVRTANAMPAEWRAQLRSAHDAYVSSVRPLVLSLGAAAGLVFLIATANVGVLLLVRATGQHREVAVRKALGASGSQIGRAIVAEAAMLGIAATALGLAIAQVVITALAPVVDRQLGRSAPGGPSAFGMDGMVLLGAAAAGLLVMAICSVVPLWAARRTPAVVALSAGQKGASAGPAQQRARSGLIVIEVAACLTLLVGAALMVQSGLRILQQGVGLDPRDTVVGMVTLRQATYPDATSQAAFLERTERVATATPGVRGIAFANAWPLQEPASHEVRADGPGAPPATRAGLVGVTSAYFELLGIPMIDGRTFSSRDRVGSTPVAVISETLARRLWPGGRAVGQMLSVGPARNAPATAVALSHEVVGVVGDTRHSHTDADTADVFVALSQRGARGAFLYVGTTGSAATIGRDVGNILGQVDRDIAPRNMQPLADILDRQRAGTRFLAQVLVVFAALAAVLAIVGIYGVISYTVRQRRREIAVRIAIGADRSAITSLFVRHGALTLTMGLALGLGGSLALGTVLQSQLFGVSPTEPILLTSVTAAFAACGLLAILWPARAAASTDPAEALRD